MSRPKVFVSYARHDHEDAQGIVRALRSLGVPVWTDQQIRMGREWMSEIEEALRSARVIVLCVSPSFLASDWANLEIGVALSRSQESGVRVVPVVFRDSSMPESLKRFQSLDVRRLSADEVAKAICSIADEQNKKDTLPSAISNTPKTNSKEAVGHPPPD